MGGFIQDQHRHCYVKFKDFQRPRWDVPFKVTFVIQALSRQIQGIFKDLYERFYSMLLQALSCQTQRIFKDLYGRFQG